MKRLTLAALAAAALAGCASVPTPTPLLARITKAPVGPDGDVTGRPTDLVLHFDASPDPTVPGRSLAVGRRIRITLPPEFADTGAPWLDYASDPRCGPKQLACSTAALLQGWPQNPVPFGKYHVEHDAARGVVTITARETIAPASVLQPGIKAVHLIAMGLRNPAPGRYPVQIEAETGPDGRIERGRAEVEILPAARPSVEVTSVFDQPDTLPKTTPPSRLSPLVQHTAASAPAPLPYNLLLWDAQALPMVGVRLEPRPGREGAYVLQRNGVEVGEAFIEAPPGAQGQRLVGDAPSQAIAAPVSALPAARLRAQFVAGDAPGWYVVHFSLHGGNAQQLRVKVAPPAT